MSGERARLRSLLGASTELWGAEGLTVEPDCWLALSGAAAVDYNVALCHGPDTVPRCRDAILEAGKPGLLMLAGAAFADAQALIEAGWVCVGAVPFLWRGLPEGFGAGETGEAESQFRRLDAEGRDAARRLVVEAFGIAPELGAVALPEATLTAPGKDVWGALDSAGELLACVATVRVEDAVCIWSLATADRARRRGVGGRLVTAALAAAAEEGAGFAALQAAPQARGFYAGLGFAELEWWQLWSRPRWMLGRA